MSQPRRIAVTSTENLRVLGTIGQRSVELITGTLKRRLTSEHAFLFAEPVLSDAGDQSDWYSACPGTVMRLSDLSEADALAVENRLAILLDDIRTLSLEFSATKDPEVQRLGEALENATIFPGSQSVYVLEKTGPADDDAPAFQPVLVDWASEKDVRSAAGAAGLIAWTPRRQQMTVAAAAALAPVAVQASTHSDREPRSRNWLVGLLALLIGGLTVAILLLLLPSCGLRSVFGANFCPSVQTVAAVQQADDLDRITREREVLENRIAFLERDLNASETACANLVPPPPEEPDAIDERLDREGATSGELNFALVWDGQADLDLHITCPGGETIFFRNQSSAACGGVLDIDMNAGGVRSNDPVEHIYFENPRSGNYAIRVNYYDASSRRGTVNFVLRISFGDRQEEFRGSVSAGQPNWTENFVYAE